MTIFGNADIDGYRVHNSTAVDIIANYGYGTILIIAIPLGLFLNPIVFYYNWKQKLTLATGLFQLLSFLDFIYTYRTVMTVYDLLKPWLEPIHRRAKSSEEEFFWKVHTMFGYGVGYSSMCVTFSLGVVRYVKIRFPIWSFSNGRKIVVATLGLVAIDFTYNVILPIFRYFRSDLNYAWFSCVQGVIDLKDRNVLWYVFSLVPFYIKIGISVVVSGLTVYALRTDRIEDMTAEKMRSVIMIILLNIGNLVWFIMGCLIGFASFFTEFNPNDRSFYYPNAYLCFMDLVAMPCLLAAYNPLILCLRSTGIHDMVKRVWRKNEQRTLTLAGSSSSSRSPLAVSLQV